MNRKMSSEARAKVAAALRQARRGLLAGANRGRNGFDVRAGLPGRVGWVRRVQETAAYHYLTTRQFQTRCWLTGAVYHRTTVGAMTRAAR